MTDKEYVAPLGSLKRLVFFELLKITGRAFIIVKYSEDVIIGNRGFLKEEKESGLILVLNNRMDFQWGEHALTAKLVFGATPHDCIIPIEHIIAVYSPELQTQLVVTYRPPKELEPEQKPADTEQPFGESDNNVLKVDFTRKKKK